MPDFDDTPILPLGLNTGSLRELSRPQTKAASLRCRHIVLTGCTLTFYGYALSVLDGRRRLTSAAWREMLGELYPDATKSAERLTEAEVSPMWGETMHADDVTKNLNWFQTFCRMKYGMDDHVPFYWHCDIRTVEVDWDHEGKQPLDPNMNCSAEFINRHIVDGDDPRCVPWGGQSLQFLGKLVAAEGNPAGAARTAAIPPKFDEFTVHSGAQLFAPLQQQLHELFREIHELKSLWNKSKGSSSSQAPPAAARRLETIPAPFLHSHRQDVQGSLLMPRPRRQPTYVARRQRRWSQAKIGFDKACGPIRGVCPAFRAPPVDADEVPCRCFTLPKASDVRNTCRNHHWGLLHLCRPDLITVWFQIMRVACDESPPAANCTPLTWFSVKMGFMPIKGVARDEPSGWYTARLQLDEGKAFGMMTTQQGILGIMALLSLLWFLLQGPLWALVLFPCHCLRVLALRHAELGEEEASELSPLPLDSPGTDVDEQDKSVELPSPAQKWLNEEFDRRFAELIGGRAHRTSYMGNTDIISENLAGLLMLCGFFQSLVGVASGPQSAGEIDAWEYIFAHLSGFRLVSELLYQCCFDSTLFHGCAWFIMYITTIMSIFDSIEGLRWLPAIMRLSAARVSYFLFAYALAIFGFGMVFWIQFGARFVQFSTLQRAWYELFLLSCGLSFDVFMDVNPFEDNRSMHVSCFLAIYIILIVTVSLNIFTTIILDAYRLAKRNSDAVSAMQRIKKKTNEALMHCLGISAGQYSVDSDIDFDPLGRSPSEPTLRSRTPLAA